MGGGVWGAKALDALGEGEGFALCARVVPIRCVWHATRPPPHSRPSSCPPPSGSTVLNYYSLGEVDKWTYMGYLALFFIVFFLLALITMTFKKYQSR